MGFQILNILSKVTNVILTKIVCVCVFSEPSLLHCTLPS